MKVNEDTLGELLAQGDAHAAMSRLLEYAIEAETPDELAAVVELGLRLVTQLAMTLEALTLVRIEQKLDALADLFTPVELAAFGEGDEPLPAELAEQLGVEQLDEVAPAGEYPTS